MRRPAPLKLATVELLPAAMVPVVSVQAPEFWVTAVLISLDSILADATRLPVPMLLSVNAPLLVLEVRRAAS